MLAVLQYLMDTATLQLKSRFKVKLRALEGALTRGWSRMQNVCVSIEKRAHVTTLILEIVAGANLNASTRQTQNCMLIMIGITMESISMIE